LDAEIFSDVALCDHRQFAGHIEHLKAEKRALRPRLGPMLILVTDAERRTLGALARKIGAIALRGSSMPKGAARHAPDTCGLSCVTTPPRITPPVPFTKFETQAIPKTSFASLTANTWKVSSLGPMTSNASAFFRPFVVNVNSDPIGQNRRAIVWHIGPDDTQRRIADAEIDHCRYF
jgi:hypothetical protein